MINAKVQANDAEIMKIQSALSALDLGLKRLFSPFSSLNNISYTFRESEVFLESSIYMLYTPLRIFVPNKAPLLLCNNDNK